MLPFKCFDKIFCFEGAWPEKKPQNSKNFFRNGFQATFSGLFRYPTQKNTSHGSQGSQNSEEKK